MLQVGGAVGTTARGLAVPLAVNRVDVVVGQAPRAEAEHGAGNGGCSAGFGSRCPAQPDGELLEAELSSGQETLSSDTPVRSVAANDGPNASPEPSASGQDQSD